MLLSLCGITAQTYVSVSLEWTIKEAEDSAQLSAVSARGGHGRHHHQQKNLQAFVNDNPKHPLVADAKQVIAEL